MQKHANNRAKAIRGFLLSPKERVLTLLLILFISGGPLLAQSQCPCIEGGYEIGDPNDPDSETWLSETTLYAENPNGLTSGCVNISGTLLVNRDYLFDYTAIVMDEGAEIEVRSYKTLTIRNQTALFGCEFMWRGISLNAYAELDMQDSWIRNAQYAVQAKNLSKLALVNNIFDANYVGVYVPPTGFSFANTITVNDIRNNLFSSDLTYLPPYAGQFPSPGTLPYSAFLINDVQGFNIGHPSNGSIVNTIENIEHGVINRGWGQSWFNGLNITQPDNLYQWSVGILIEDTPLRIDVEDCVMDNVAYGIKSLRSRSKDITQNTINSTFTGIWIQDEKKGDLLIESNILISIPSSSPQGIEGYGIRIINCNLNDNFAYDILGNNITVREGAGIYVQDMQGSLDITDDNFIDFSYIPGSSSTAINVGVQLLRTLGPATIKDTHISVVPPFGGYAGITVQDSKNTQVVENDITGEFWTGMYLEFSPTTLYCCNQTPSMILGGHRIVGLCNDTKLANTSFIGQQSSFPTALYMIDAQIGPQTNFGNDWTGTNTWRDASFSGNPGLVQWSVFKTDPALVPNGHNKIVVPVGSLPSDWFKFVGTDLTCQAQVNCGVPPYSFGGDPNEFTVLTNLDLNALVPVTENNTVLDVLKWEEQRYLYRKLVNNPSLVNWNPDVTAFYASAQNGLVGEFHAVESGIRSLAFPPEPMNGDEDAILLGLDGLGASLNSIEVQLLTADEQQQAILLAQKAALLLQLDSLMAERDAIELLIASWRTGQVASLIAANNAIVAQTPYQGDEKTVFDIYLQTVAQGNTIFTTAQQATVDGIANKCPSLDGTGVPWARGLRQYYAVGWPWDMDDCVGVNNRSDNPVANETGSSQMGVHAFPNPTSGTFTVQLAQPLDTDAKVAIYDTNGRLVAGTALSSGSPSTVVDLNDLNPSIYIYKVKVEGKAIATGQITLVDK